MRKTFPILPALALAAKIFLGCGDPKTEISEQHFPQEVSHQTPIPVEDIREEGEIPLAPINCSRVYQNALAQITGIQINSVGNLAWTEALFYTNGETVWKGNETVWYGDAEKTVKVQDFTREEGETVFDALPILSERFLSLSMLSSKAQRNTNTFYDPQKNELQATNLETVLAADADTDTDVFIAPLAEKDANNNSFAQYHPETKTTTNICPISPEEVYQPILTTDLALSENLLYIPSRASPSSGQEWELALRLCDVTNGGQLVLPMPEPFIQLAVENSRVVYLRPLEDSPLYGLLRTIDMNALASENFLVNGEEKSYLFVFRNAENSNDLISLSQLQLSEEYVVFTSCEDALLRDTCESEERVAVYGYDFSQRRLERISPFWHQPSPMQYDIAAVKGKFVAYLARRGMIENLYLCEREE